METNANGFPMFPIAGGIGAAEGYSWYIPDEVMWEMPDKYQDWVLEMARRGWMVKFIKKDPPWQPRHECHLCPFPD